jgi:hypothetical protein
MVLHSVIFLTEEPEINQLIDPVVVATLQKPLPRIYMMDSLVYQSALHIPIVIQGSYFERNMSLVTSPPLQESVDYSMEYLPTASTGVQLTLSLLPGRKWRQTPGPLHVVSMLMPDGRNVTTAGYPRIVAVYPDPDPVVVPAPVSVPDPEGTGTVFLRQTQSKRITLAGTGVSDPAAATVLLQPTHADGFRILRGTTVETMHLELVENGSWFSGVLRPTLAGTGDGNVTSMPLLLLGLNSGPGLVMFDPPIILATVIADIPGIVCDDTCSYAFDGICSDGQVNSSNYHLNVSSGPKEPMHDSYGSYIFQPDPPNCDKGTDCSDCGGADAIAQQLHLLPNGEAIGINVTVKCDNTCVYANDGECDDPRSAGDVYCAMGTDCNDCGPIEDPTPDKDDDNDFDDSDDNVGKPISIVFSLGSCGFLVRVTVLKLNVVLFFFIAEIVHHRSTAAALVVVLEGTVFAFCGVVLAAVLYFLNLWVRGNMLPLPYMPVSSQERAEGEGYDFEVDTMMDDTQHGQEHGFEFENSGSDNSGSGNIGSGGEVELSQLRPLPRG